mgnify:CR=1 FL=1
MTKSDNLEHESVKKNTCMIYCRYQSVNICLQNTNHIKDDIQYNDATTGSNTFLSESSNLNGLGTVGKLNIKPTFLLLPTPRLL